MAAEEFLTEYKKLKYSVPRAALFNTNSENSEYTSYSISNKNVYICMGCENNEDCYYNYWIYTNKDAVDSAFLYDSEIAYECVDVKHSYNMLYCQDCTDCRDLFLCYDCIGASDCFGCIGIRRKQYHIFNKPFSKEEYEREYATLRCKWHTKEGQAEIRKRFEELKAQIGHLYMHQLNTENCTGDYVYNSRNCLWSFDVRDCEDGQYLYNTFDLKNCSDCSFVKEGELIYESLSCFGHDFNFCYVCWGGSNLDFCELCFNCSDCLGCIGLKNKRFYILNKPYSKEEYKKIAPQIKSQLREAGWYAGTLPSVFREG